MSGALASRANKRNVVISDDEEDEGPRKKTKARLPVEDDPDIDSEETGLDERPKRMKTRVFSQASEDAQVTRANTEASFNLGDSENEFTGAGHTTEGGSDEEEWKYSQLDEMAAKDARVSNNF